MNVLLRLAWLAFVLLLPLTGLAQKKPGEVVSLLGIEIKGDVKPGATVSAVLRFQVEKAHYIQSSKPSDKFFIATTLTLTNTPGVSPGAVAYPEGKSYPKKDLPKPLSIYEGTFALTVPLTLGADVVLPAEVPASLRYQACKEPECYPPRTLKVAIPLTAAR